MTSQNIPSDSTVRSIVDRLADKEEYVRGAFGNLSRNVKEHGSACLRLGVMGEGQYPHYRIESPNREPECYDSRNHKEVFQHDLLRDENWSTETTTLDDLRSLFAEIAPHRLKKG
jgi:hypothetical protein